MMLMMMRVGMMITMMMMMKMMILVQLLTYHTLLCVRESVCGAVGGIL